MAVVDIGNTSIVLGFLDGDAIVSTYRITTKANHTSDEYGLFLAKFLRMGGFQPSDMDNVIICSVVSRVIHSFRSPIVKSPGIDLMVAEPGIRAGMNARVDDPKSLSADALTNRAGVYYEYGGPVPVADFGTAITFTHVGDKGVVDSGVITTGIRVGTAALWGNTAQLPEAGITRSDMILDTNTKTCVQAGLYYTFLGGVERMIRQFRRELGGKNFKVITTGGLSRVFENDAELINMYNPNLISKGMAHIYSHNVK